MDSEQGSTRTGLEGRSMSLGAMTVMSYDIWKAKCAAEKKRLESEGKAPPSPLEAKPEIPMRKRAHTFIAPGEAKELPKVQPPNGKEKKGRYILLPTIPAMRIFVDEEMEKKMDENMDDTPAQPVESQVSEMKINSPIALKPIQSLPNPQLTSNLPLQQNFMKPTVSITVPSLPLPTTLPMAQTIPRTQPNLSFPPATTATGFSAEQLVLLQNNILHQQNQALQQLLALLPMNNPTPPTTTPSPDLLSLLKCQQLAMPVKAEPGPQDLLQSLLAPRQQAIFSHSPL